MSFVSYAQNFEDVLLHRAFREVKKGRYLDIGAQDPVVDSVSLAFYEAGWRGIHVEPTPIYAARLREARPDEMVIEAAVSDAPGNMRFYHIPDTGLSTGKGEIAKTHGSAGYDREEIVVPCIRLDELFEHSTGELHWLKIDVEGMEADVLRSWGGSEQRPWVLVVESTAPNTQERTDGVWLQDVLQRGYKSVFFDGLSRYFLHESHEELAQRFDAPANVFDRFMVARHHFSASRMREELHATSQRLDQEWARAEQLTAQLHESRRAHEIAREELKNAIERLAAAHHEHRASLETHLEQHRQKEDLLGQTVNEAQATAATAREDAARFGERASQLQERLDNAQRELADVRNLLQLTESNAERDAADARSRIASVEHERNEARELAQRLRDDLEAQLSGLQASLAEANAIIAAVAAEGSGRWQRIGEALGFARPRQSSRALAAWEAASDAKSPISDSSNDTGKRESMTNAHAVAARNPYQRANSLAELLSWDDVDFVRCAYVTVLGRQPDSGGEAHYADRLRRGRPKTEVLWNLRRSPEARRHDPGIAGLDRALKRAHWKHYLLSAFVRSTGAAGAMPSSARGMREDLAEIEDQLTSLSSKIDQMQQSLAFIEGGLLKSTERDENLVPLDPDSFARRLAIAARNFESAAQ